MHADLFSCGLTDTHLGCFYFLPDRSCSGERTSSYVCLYSFFRVLEVELLGQSSLRLFSDSGSGVPSEKLQLHFQQESVSMSVSFLSPAPDITSHFIYDKMKGERWHLLLTHISLPTNPLCSWQRSCFSTSNICSLDSPGPGAGSQASHPTAQLPSAPASAC